MHFRSTIIIPREHRVVLFQDLQHASGYTAAKEDWEVLYYWYHWVSNVGEDGALVYVQPESMGNDVDLLSPREKAYPHEWFEVCKILAFYTPEGSVLEWNDEDCGFFRFFFTGKKVVFQIGKIIYQDQSLSARSLL